MEIYALFMICGFCLSLLIPETKGKTLEELSGEDDEDAMRRNFEENRRMREAKVARREESRAGRKSPIKQSMRPAMNIDELVG